MKPTIHDTADDCITECIDTRERCFEENQVEACHQMTVVEAAQHALDILLVVVKKNPEIVWDVIKAAEVEVLESDEQWHEYLAEPRLVSGLNAAIIKMGETGED